MSPIPNELVDAIIDNLHDDPRALAVCAQVARAWIPSSRYHQFAAVHLRRRNTACFLALLKPSTTIAAAVQTVRITCDGAEDLIRHAAPRLAALRAVTALTIDTPRGVRDIPTPYAAALATIFPRVKFLYLESLRFANTAALLYTLGAFPALRSAHLAWIQCRDMKDAPPAIAVPPQLDTLAFAQPSFGNVVPDVLAWATTSAPTPPPLRALALSLLRAAHLPAVNEYLRAVSPTLHTLHIETAEPAFAGDKGAFPAHVVDLAACTHLRAVSLDHPHLAQLPAFLERLASPHIAQLAIAIGTADPACLRAAVDWARVARALQGAQFAGLRALVLGVGFQEDLHATMAFVQGALPFLAPGVLRYAYPTAEGFFPVVAV